MKLFLDTANLADINELMQTGLIDGITTNPTNLSKIEGNPTHVVREICTIMGDRPVSIEVTEEEPKAVYAQAQRIARLAKNAVVKIPCYQPYYELIKSLADDNITINITLVFSLAQALFMCKLGVCYISPFIARWDDIDVEGKDILIPLRQMVDQYGYKTNILAASLRNMRHLHAAIDSGADIATISPALFRHATDHPLTNAGMTLFKTDWEKINNTVFPTI